MKIIDALETCNCMLVNGNRWLVLKNGVFVVFEHHLRKATDEKIYSGADEEAAVEALTKREQKLTS